MFLGVKLIVSVIRPNWKIPSWATLAVIVAAVSVCVTGNLLVERCREEERLLEEPEVLTTSTARVLYPALILKV